MFEVHALDGTTSSALEVKQCQACSARGAVSAGIHYCLGAALARAEGQIVFDSLLDRYSKIEPAWSDDAPLRYRDNLVLRGLEALPVRLLA